MSIVDQRKAAADKERRPLSSKKGEAEQRAPAASSAKRGTERGGFGERGGVFECRSSRQVNLLAPRSDEDDDPISAIELLGVQPGQNGKNLTAREWVDVIRGGIPAQAVDSLTSFLVISKTELSDAIDIPLRTLSGRKAADRLPRDETAKLVRVARVIERAEEVFEDPVAARNWLKSPNTALSGETPVSLLDTEVGAESVLDALGRIEHGVFA